ncbi:MAG: TusE/DsrC/DsvC family sulfur relay protein [Gemmatimonadota bacterium]|jgi:TusE/DsrC/DsvC family sulfur relay protein|nr:TusE/DsrC/DsvC family sulfur relay protein [Gemmatimonadota bacterium]
MPTMTLNDAVLELDAEGFLADANQWNEGVAEAIARENGIPVLTEDHWKVIRYMRDTWFASGQAPTIRSLGKESGVDVKTLYKLFPKGPAKLAAKIAGIPKPHGCI